MANDANPYDLPIHDQGDKNNCTSHAFASMTEDLLSRYFKERTLVDVDDLWEKQLKYGTATKAGDRLDGPVVIGAKYGIRFKTDSGKTGTLFIVGQNKKDGWLNVLDWRVVLD
jgi:hypothetical protein